MKRTLSLVLSLVMILGIFASMPVTVSAATRGKCGDNLTWTLDDEGTLTITGTGDMYDYPIKSDYPVNFSWDEFYGTYPWTSSKVKTVCIDDGVTSIGRQAFWDCDNLTSVTIGSGVTSMGYEAFMFCSSINAVNITDIAKWCNIDFANDDSNPLYYANNLYLNGDLVTDLVIPDSVTSIGGSAFNGCTSLTSITIPDSVTSIGGSAFNGCTSLTSITIPDKVTSIGSHAFDNCTKLTSITIPDSVTSIGVFAFDNTAYYNSSNNWENGVLYIGNHLIDANTSLSGAYIIKTGTKTIAKYAFDNCTKLTSITIPDSVTIIGFYAFNGCTSLTSVTIGDSVTSIGNYVFRGCTSLTSVTIGDSVKSIGSDAFNGCTSLTSITIPDSVTSIGSYAFSGCTSLTSITIPDSVTSIGSYAFSGCTSLTSITIPDGVTSIVDSAFRGCTSLTSVTIGDSVTSIGSHAFYGCTSLTSITIGDSVTSIGSHAFYGCTSLTSITIPDSVTSIGSHAFDNCTKLTSITIPDSVTSIGVFAFDNTAYYNSSNNWENGVLYIGNHLIDAQNTLSGNYIIKNDTKIISDYAFYGCTSLTSITIPDSVTSIGNWAFYDCTSLTSVTIGNSVTSIGGGAFYNTAYYNNSNNWQNGVLYIGNHLIDANTSLGGAYTIKSGTKTIAGRAFGGCKTLTSITIPDSVTSIGDYAFRGCTSLTSITVDSANKNYSSFDRVLFDKEKTELLCYPAGKTSKSYTIPNGVKSIVDSAFYNCTKLTSITIPDSVTIIGFYAFNGCTSLTSVTIGDSVTSIGSYAFYECTNLIKTYYYGTKAQWDSINIEGYNEALFKNIIYNYATYKPATPKVKAANTINGMNVTWNAVDDAVKYELYKRIGTANSWTYVTTTTGTSYADNNTPSAGSYYVYTVKAYTVVGVPSDYVKANCAAVQRVVAPVTKAANAVNGINVTWNIVAGANKYVVLRRLGTNNTWVIIGETTGSSYLDKNVTAGTYYLYSIRAVNNTGYSEYDINKRATIQRLVVPKTTTSNELGGIKVSWNKVSGGTKYNVYRRQGGSSNWSLLGTTTGTTFFDSNVTSGIYYSYYISVCNNSGHNSAYLQANSNTRKYMEVPKLAGITNATNGLYIKWNAVAGVTNGYRVYRRGAGSTYWTYLGTVKTTNFTDTSVKARSGEYFRYTVIADGGYHSKFDTTGLYLKRLANPELKSAVSSSSGITVKWETVVGTTGYYVYRKTVNSSWVRIASVGGTNNTTFLDKTAKKGTTYTYTVRAVYGATTSAYNSGISCYDRY